MSWALHPFVLPLYLMALLLTRTAFAYYPAGVKIYLLWVVALYAIVLPLLGLAVLRSLGRISDYRLDDRRERLWAPRHRHGLLCALRADSLQNPPR